MADEFRVREAIPEDRPVIEAMLFEAFFWRPGTKRPPRTSFLAESEPEKWLDGFFERSGDRAMLAERVITDGDGRTPQAVGAAFHRLFSDACHSYGFIDESTPEVAIGVAPDARGMGVGRALLEALIRRARGDGHGALSLSVEPDNFARHLYERSGFSRVGENEGSWTMRRSLGT